MIHVFLDGVKLEVKFNGYLLHLVDDAVLPLGLVLLTEGIVSLEFHQLVKHVTVAFLQLLETLLICFEIEQLRHIL